MKTKDNPNPKYNFTDYMYKYPCYYRRAAINQAIGKVSSYKSNLANWENTHQGERPGIPKAGYVYPALYRQVCVKECIGDCYHVQIKVWIRNTWDWVTVSRSFKGKLGGSKGRHWKKVLRRGARPPVA
ncbi:MAG: hypothetical protein IKO00_00680 [Oscillospiraceae bacterium]|nr:hypothetical protein [Oscillospiraceae bacterium]